MRASIEVADIFRSAGPAYRAAHAGHLSLGQLKVMTAIENCRTAALGGHVEACDDCGHWRIAYNSCRNRHCPKCQGAAARTWLAAREADLLPVGYFHVVFTVPAEIADIAWQNKAVVYDLLFRAAADTMLTIAADPKHLGARIGITAVLHTWGTATPRFIYGRNDRSDGVTAEGRPFHIDMTFASDEVGGSTYLGFDFGTSASACSLVDSNDVQMIQERSRSAEWRELSELLSELPYPAAAPLARFISETDSHRRPQKGREAAEALLTLAAYVAYMDACSCKATTGAVFKG